MNFKLWNIVEPHIRAAQPKSKAASLKSSNGSGWITDLHSPLRKDQNPSFSIKPDDADGGSWKDFGTGEGGSLLDLAKRLELDVSKAPLETIMSVMPKDPEETFARWCAGRRLNPKRLRSYWHCKPRNWFDRQAILFPTPIGIDRIKFLDNDKPKSKWRKKGGKHCWYGLEQAKSLLGEPGQTLYLVNGEPSVWACDQAGVPAICTCMSEERSPDNNEIKQLAKAVPDVRIAVVFDLDEPGENGAQKVLAALRLHQVNAVALKLPDYLGKGGDVDDLHRRVGKDLGKVLAALPPLQVKKADDDDDGRPWIESSGRQLSDIIEDAWNAVIGANDPPIIFSRDGILVHLVQGKGGWKLRAVTEKWLLGRLADTARWFRWAGCQDERVRKDCLPPDRLVGVMLANPDRRLPELDAIVASPVFDCQGRLVARPGYHRQSRLWYYKPPGFELATIPEKPTVEEVQESVSFLFDSVLAEFPFDSEPEKAHALAAIILPFVRRMIDGCTPLHLFEAPVPGSGKTYLTEIINVLVTGDRGSTTRITRNEEENTKTLAAVLLRAPTIIRLDNIATGIDSSVLAEVLTTHEWECRILGQTQTACFPNQVLWCATSNNPALSKEVARRTVRIRLNPKMENPETRSFKNPKRLEWTMRHRGEILGHVFTIVLGWVAAGCPRADIIHGGFNSWAETIGGILQFARVPGLLENQAQLYEMSDDESSIWREFVAAWWDKQQNQWTRIKQLLDLCLDGDLLERVIGDKNPRSQQVRLGKAMKSMRDRQFDGKTIVAEIDNHSKCWTYRLSIDDDDPVPPPQKEDAQKNLW